MLVMARATVLYELAAKAGVKDLPEANFAWQMVALLGRMFPMHDSNLGAMIRTKVMTDDVEADELALKTVTAAAIKYYGTWRTYDNAVGTARGAASQQLEPAADSDLQDNIYYLDDDGEERVYGADDCEEPQSHVNTIASGAPSSVAPSEAGTVISMADLRSVLQGMGVMPRGVAPAVNIVQHPQQASSTTSTVISMADLRSVLQDLGY
jgi:hypothetical protein